VSELQRLNFYPRDAMLARCLLSSRVRPSVRYKSMLYRNVGSQKQRRTIAQGLVLWYKRKDLYQIPMVLHHWGAKCRLFM